MDDYSYFDTVTMVSDDKQLSVYTKVKHITAVQPDEIEDAPDYYKHPDDDTLMLMSLDGVTAELDTGPGKKAKFTSGRVK